MFYYTFLVKFYLSVYFPCIVSPTIPYRRFFINDMDVYPSKKVDSQIFKFIWYYKIIFHNHIFTWFSIKFIISTYNPKTYQFRFLVVWYRSFFYIFIIFIIFNVKFFSFVWFRYYFENKLCIIPECEMFLQILNTIFDDRLFGKTIPFHLVPYFFFKSLDLFIFGYSIFHVFFKKFSNRI